MTYEEAIEKMARRLHALDAEGHTGNGPAPTFEECSQWYFESARAAAEAVSLQEKIGALERLREIDRTRREHQVSQMYGRTFR